jgi:hypothetical protein
MLTLKQVQDKCLYNKAADQCRFLAEDDKGNFYCIKHTHQKADIDKEVFEFKKNQRAKGIDPNTLSIPIGDNCKGYTFFRYKMQGYDLP